MPQVYAGVPHDYTGNNYTLANFWNVLNGESMDGVGSGKTLASGPNDFVFIFYADHGTNGYVLFGETTNLTADDLQKVSQ